MDPDRLKAGESFKDLYLEGESVPTSVGVAAMATGNSPLVPYANAFVDYTGVKESLRDGYTKALEDAWNKEYFKRGLTLNRKSPTIVVVSSKRETLAVELGGSEVDVLRAPSFFVDLYGDKDPIDKFFDMASKMGFWLFHIKTTAHSYIWMVSYTSGDIVHSYRREPLNVTYKEGGANG